jgi:hypothetical protein
MVETLEDIGTKALKIDCFVQVYGLKQEIMLFLYLIYIMMENKNGFREKHLFND